VPLSIQAVVDALGAHAPHPFAVTLPDGARHACGDGAPAFTLHLRTEAAMLATLARGHIGLLEAYFDGEVDVDGSFHAAMAVGLASDLSRGTNPLLAAENRLHELRHSNRDPAQAKANARFHYGLGEPFYRLWLDDPLKMYTCAYWREGTTTLEQAQRNKIDHVIRKIRLGPGERYVDIGCGFGGFMFRAWETVGALGTGVNTTTEQVAWLRAEIARRGLADRLSVREADFRDVDGPYDKVVSIGVLEHAGRDQLAEVIRAHADFLKPGGLGMLHFIGHVGRYDTERFERHWPQIQALDPRRFDERFRRIWRTYLVGCAEMFRAPSGYTHLWQIVFSKGNVTPDNYPMSRAHLYRDDAGDGGR
jgi:cyclopropane-fatty-acyl-phospholipid synthase